MTNGDWDNRDATSSNINAEAPTEAIDYLVLKRSRVRYSKTKHTTHHSVGVDATNAPLQGQVEKERKPGCVYLAMPPQLSTAYQASYSQQNLGVAGMAVTDMIGRSEDGFSGISKALSDAAGASLPEFTDALAAGVFQSMGNALGLQGTVDANTIEQMAAGRVFNPFSEQIFKSMAFRTHSFNFKMLARSQQEAREIKSIIQWIKEGATPEIQKGDKSSMGALWDATENKGKHKGSLTTGSGDGKKDVKSTSGQVTDKANAAIFRAGVAQRFFNIPDHFDLRFVRVNPTANPSNWFNPMNGNFQDNTGYQTMHFKIHSSFCNGVGINYTPDGQYTSFKTFDGSMIQVPAINLSLSFIETRLVSRQDVEIGF